MTITITKVCMLVTLNLMPHHLSVVNNRPTATCYSMLLPNASPCYCYSMSLLLLLLQLMPTTFTAANGIACYCYCLLLLLLLLQQQLHATMLPSAPITVTACIL